MFACTLIASVAAVHTAVHQCTSEYRQQPFTPPLLSILTLRCGQPDLHMVHVCSQQHTLGLEQLHHVTAWRLERSPSLTRGFVMKAFDG